MPSDMTMPERNQGAPDFMEIGSEKAELTQRVADFIEMEMRSCSASVFSPEYVARSLQICLTDAEAALRALKKR